MAAAMLHCSKFWLWAIFQPWSRIADDGNLSPDSFRAQRML